MRLNELLQGIEVLSTTTGSLDPEITGLVYDSRRAEPGSLFVALPGGNEDGIRYIEDAVSRGAVAVVSETACQLGGGLPAVQVENARLAMARLASAFYQHPSDRLDVLGITGTNGKTTVSFMLREIFKEAGSRSGLIGTVRYEIGDRVLPASRTTPESPDLQSMLAQMVRAGCKQAVMEVSSHALMQNRVDRVDFDVAVFTNLTQDHLDYHGTLESYFSAKARLFSPICRLAVINRDDTWGKRLLSDQRCVDGAVSYGFEEGADFQGLDPVSDTTGSQMRVRGPDGEVPVRLQLIGRFNLYNALAAFAAASSVGIPADVIASALGKMTCVPGRLEAVPGSGGKRIFVDYAHTDDALSNVMQTLREITPGRLIAVFGCGGNRDREKRRLMGQVASRLADYTIITNDNPRNEIPEKIASDIASGFDSERKYEVILDRQCAIKRGVELVGRKDVLLIAGKGHETYQEFNGVIIPFDDRDVVRELVQ